MHSATCLALGLLLVASTASAVDGVIEINQTCAVNGGCFTGDTAGYPVTIDGQAGRSYRLTSDLIVPDENTDGITIGASYVGVDLNNFAIIRSGCEAPAQTCSIASGTGSGIRVTSASSIRGVSVDDGSVVGMGSRGIDLGTQSRITGVHVQWNGQHGIFAFVGSTVSGSTAAENGGAGISVSNNSTVTGNSATYNDGSGISIGTGSTALGNSVQSNGSRGISASGATTVSDNSATLNAGIGILAGDGSTVSGNTAVANDADGISAGAGSTVQRNTARNNSGYGLDLGAQSAYRENVITGNAMGTVNGASAVNMFSNSCNGTSVCP